MREDKKISRIIKPLPTSKPSFVDYQKQTNTLTSLSLTSHNIKRRQRSTIRFALKKLGKQF